MPIHGYPGNVITANPTAPTVTSASGVWTTEQQLQNMTAGNWPMAATQISRSLRFNSADSAYLSRTPASAGNRKTFTWSGWVKRSTLATATHALFGSGTSGTDYCFLYFQNDDKLVFYNYSSAGIFPIRSTNLYRDVSAWYHIVLAVDTTQATSSNRVKLYVNNEQITSFSEATYPDQNDDLVINSTNAHAVGAFLTGASDFDDYLTEINFIDGLALTPASFGQTNSSTGVWEPRQYTGPYGTNGFYLNFSDNSGTTSTTLGKDYSGRGNNWTPNNFSVTAGAGNDSLVDSPTQYGTDTGVGGEVRGNYCTLNSASPLASATADGNLRLNYNTTNCVPGTIGVTTGKWYWEGLLTTQTDSQQYFGVANSSFNLALTVGEDANSWGMTVQSNSSNGKAQHNNVQSSSYATFGNGDICMVAYDMATGKIWFGRNGTWFNSGAPASGTGEIYSNLSGTIVPMLCNDINSGGVLQVNFGQRPFAYTAPSGFKALVTTNLPTPTIGATATTQAGNYFNAVLYTGNGNSTQAVTVGFQPDFVWAKSRSVGRSHRLTNAITGVSNATLYSDSTSAQGAGPLASFDSNGFTVNNTDNYNVNAETYVSWNWNAGGSSVTNTAGSITSTVRANTTAGFSIVTYTGTAAVATVGHGLGVKPSFILTKSRSTTEGWGGYHKSLGASYGIFLELTDAAYAAINYWNNTEPTSTVFTVNVNRTNNGTMVAYCFAEVAGYSAFGRYTGNGSTDGPFIYTGFRPACIIFKVYDGTASWLIHDNKRNTYNVVDKKLFPNASDAEATADVADFLSNGFKLKGTNTQFNGNGYNYIYAAFAEFPFKYTLAR